MEKEGARLFQQETSTDWNIVELEVLVSRRQLRQHVNEIIGLSSSSRLTTSEIRQQLLLGVATFGSSFAAQLVRLLQCDDHLRRQQIVWLLTLLNDQEIIPLLQHLSRNERLSRSIRLSASLALAGMGATAETTNNQASKRLYAIS